MLVSSTALLLLTALDLMRGRLKSVLDRHFRREKHQLDRTWQRMSEAIEQLVDSPTLARRLLQTSAELLGAAGGAVYLRQGDPPLYRLTHALGPVPELTELSPGCPLIEAVREQGSATATLAAGVGPGPAAAATSWAGKRPTAWSTKGNCSACSSSDPRRPGRTRRKT